MGERVAIPESARKAFLLELHEGHTGISTTKALARMLVWWPGIDHDIEHLLQTCQVCQAMAPMPPAEKPVACPATTKPWTQLHIDYAGPIEDKMILVVVDSYSGWIEAVPTQTATSAATIEILRDIFARFGLPTCLVSDNGTSFCSAEFREFVIQNGIRHFRTAPFHPQSNGLA
ncbi:uncharacterized protein K02A2.6-like [Rhipicephalus sanguineus]|uniref:uncharacterized protein K02A2.6-like n=1 Tax=Rhipicephalus sanguineus TaxID=34632 RepID=UPI0020C388B2|nr:uncharacterized protein K02A2.6-like [Rhipicephalus sanguineus]